MGVLDFRFVSTEDQLADILIKSLNLRFSMLKIKLSVLPNPLRLLAWDTCIVPCTISRPSCTSVKSAGHSAARPNHDRTIPDVMKPPHASRDPSHEDRKCGFHP